MSFIHRIGFQIIGLHSRFTFVEHMIMIADNIIHRSTQHRKNLFTRFMILWFVKHQISQHNIMYTFSFTALRYPAVKVIYSFSQITQLKITI